ncbi:hypothetical protein [Pandoraea communis]|uniref:hypothetical protein n=1 Tax=Pandoraea communis TaxID=2508297 RepID=UPI0025A5FEBE|nr:hypothetical protein [Pandoraea communis]MDM8356643.1 hypothetical protein [Pandoraea communis]
MRIWMPKIVARAIIAYAQRTPYFDLRDYMRRWWVKKPRGHDASADEDGRRETSWGARVHNTLRSDAGRDLHDHPWWSISIVLLGGYWEIMPTEQEQPAKWDSRPETMLLRGYRRVWRGPGSIVFRRATDRHRLEIPAGGEAWSLFIMGPWQRNWGFHTPRGWVPWREYVKQPTDTKQSA